MEGWKDHAVWKMRLDSDSAAVSSSPKSSVNKWPGDFPGGAVVRNLPASTGDMGVSPGLGRSHMPRSN